MHDNLTHRSAKHVIHGLHHILPHVEAQFLPQVAKILARKFCVPQKVMLKVMARYTRLYK